MTLFMVTNIILSQINLILILLIKIFKNTTTISKTNHHPKKTKCRNNAMIVNLSV